MRNRGKVISPEKLEVPHKVKLLANVGYSHKIIWSPNQHHKHPKHKREIASGVFQCFWLWNMRKKATFVPKPLIAIIINFILRN